MTRSLAAAAAALVLSALATGSAGAAEPCWSRLLDDWRAGGRIEGNYPIACYREAIANLPEDLRQYSTAPEDIRRAMLLAVPRGRGGGPGPPPGVAAAVRGGRTSVTVQVLALVGAAVALVLALSAVGRRLQRRARARRGLGSAE